MKIKRIISIILSILLVYQVFSLTAFAESDINITTFYEDSSNVHNETFWKSNTYRYLYNDLTTDETVVLSYLNNTIEIIYNNGKALYEGFVDFDGNKSHDLKEYITIKDDVLNSNIELQFLEYLEEEKEREPTEYSLMSYRQAKEYYEARVPRPYNDKYIGYSTYNNYTGYVYECMFLEFKDLGPQRFSFGAKLSKLMSILKLTERQLSLLGFIFEIIDGIEVLAQEHTIIKYRGTQNFIRDVEINRFKYEEGAYIHHYVYSEYDYTMTHYMTTSDPNFYDIDDLVEAAVRFIYR